MDEITEVKRIWESMEARLASMDNQEREYEIINNHTDRKILGTVLISIESDEDEVIEELQENLPELFDEEKEYVVSGDGHDGTIYIEEFNPDGQNIRIAEMTTYDEIEDFDEFMENVLDIERTQYLSSGNWCTKEHTIVTGTGGPHVEFTTNYSIHVYWGGQSQESHTYNDQARATIDRIEDYLNEIYGSE